MFNRVKTRKQYLGNENTFHSFREDTYLAAHNKSTKANLWPPPPPTTSLMSNSKILPFMCWFTHQEHLLDVFKYVYFVFDIQNCSYGAQASTLGGLLPCYSYCTQRLTHLNDDQRARQSKAGRGKMDNKQLWQQTNWVRPCLLFTATVTSLTRTIIEKLCSNCEKHVENMQT